MHLLPVVSSDLCPLCSHCSFLLVNPSIYSVSLQLLTILQDPTTYLLHTASPESSLVFPHSFILVLVSLCCMGQFYMLVESVNSRREDAMLDSFHALPTLPKIALIPKITYLPFVIHF